MQVGQLLSQAEKLGLHTFLDVLYWQLGFGLGNPWMLSDAADKWNEIATQITDSITALNTGANMALSGKASGTDPQQQLSSVGSGDIWHGESAQNFASYVSGLNTPLVKLHDDAKAVAKGLSEASMSCYIVFAAAAALAVSVATAGTVDVAGAVAAAGAAGTAGVIGGIAVITAVSGLLDKIVESIDKFFQAKDDIVSGRDEPSGLLAGGRFVPADGHYTPPPDPQGS
jgi:hypothetical protein